MVVIWALNGYVQSMDWAPSVKTVANWFPRRMRGRIGGILGSSYQIGNALSWLLAGLLAAYLDWRWLFCVPAIILAAAAVHWYVRGRNAPEVVGLPCLEEEDQGETSEEALPDHHLGFRYTLGAIFAGWLSDKVFHLRRAPASAIMLLALVFFTWLFPQIPGRN